MAAPNQFRHYLIIQDAEGSNVELGRTSEQVAVLAYDTHNLEFVHCHVMLEALKDRNSFSEASEKLRKNGHPLLARIVEFGEDEGNPYYITSNVDGETLRAYLARQQDIPVWLAVMIACRALEAGLAVYDRGEFLCDEPMETMRLVQTGPHAVQVQVADFRLLESAATRAMKSKMLKANFERQSKFLKTFLLEQSGGGPTMPESPLHAVDFGELLGGCLSAMSGGLAPQVRDFRAALQKLVPEHLSGEIPTAQKPRALVAPLLASYQEVARGVVNLVRIQSQRLDMANPYSMRGTLSRSGRLVMVEQVPPARLTTAAVQEADRQVLKLSKKRDYSALVPLVLVNEVDGVTCMAEEVVEGVCLADLLRERKALDPHEAYVVLAGLDAALAQIEKGALSTKKLRLEDVYLLTGFAREDSRTPKLMAAKLNEWPAFTIMVRAHPSIAAMAGRGTDPAVLLPASSLNGKTAWTAGWMAAMGRFLLGFDSARSEDAVADRERETVVRLLDDELQKARDGLLASRADFLARFARVVQHCEQVKPVPVPAGHVEVLNPASRTAPAAKPKPIGAKAAKRKGDPPPAAAEPPPPPIVPGAPVIFGGPLAATASKEKSNVGFAEILFQTAGPEVEAETEVITPPWEEADSAPGWLKAIVFAGGSMVLGALFAHLSGDALWLKKGHSPRVAPKAATTTPAPPAASPAPASTAAEPDPLALPPVRVPEIVAADDRAQPAPAVSLKPPKGSNLRSLISEETPASPAAPPAPDNTPVRAAIPVPDP